MRLSDLTIT